MNTIVEVYDVAYKNAESLVRKAKFYLKGYHKFERPTVEEAIETLLFVDFKRGTINNYHAKYEPEQHIAYWSPQLAQDIDDVNERFAFFKDEMYKQLHTMNQHPAFRRCLRQRLGHVRHPDCILLSRQNRAET